MSLHKSYRKLYPDVLHHFSLFIFPASRAEMLDRKGQIHVMFWTAISWEEKLPRY
jgi:hypothetical protein